jgi:hypothetical protein
LTNDHIMIDISFPFLESSNKGTIDYQNWMSSLLTVKSECIIIIKAKDYLTI